MLFPVLGLSACARDDHFDMVSRDQYVPAFSARSSIFMLVVSSLPMRISRTLAAVDFSFTGADIDEYLLHRHIPGKI